MDRPASSIGISKLHGEVRAIKCMLASVLAQTHGRSNTETQASVARILKVIDGYLDSELSGSITSSGREDLAEVAKDQLVGARKALADVQGLVDALLQDETAVRTAGD